MMTMLLNPEAPAYSEEVVLDDGKRVTIRPICSSDKLALQEFHSRLSSETRFLRYHYSKGSLTEEDLRNYCDIDYSDRMGLIAEEGVDSNKQIIGVGRYIRLADPEIAEVAFVVQDRDQNKGLGTQLLKHLSILACQRGIRYFVGEVLRQNSRMLKIFRKSDPDMGHQVDSLTTCNVTLSVPKIIRS
jgi:hypothetical protein